MRTTALIALAALAAFALQATLTFADEPPGKQDSPVSPLLQQFIEQREDAAGQGGSPPEGGAVIRSPPDSDANTKEAEARATTASGTSESQDDPVRFDSSGNVQVYIHLENTDTETLQELRDLGAGIEITNSDVNIVQAWVPPSALDDIAALDAVDEITAPDYGQNKTGRINTEGDGIHRADLVRTFSGLTGRGVRVGVISDGVDSWASARSSGDLPDSIEINPDDEGSGDEGTALLEIIHDLAPGVDLAFSGSGSSLGFVEATLWLANEAFDGEGADIIVDDVGYYSEPYFEDGVVAQAAEDAVAGGVVFVSAAGNFADGHYAGEFSDDGNGYHDFDDDPDATDITLSVELRSSLVLQWNDQFGASDNDYDLFVCPPGLKPVKFNLQNGICEGSTREQNGDDDPYEIISFVFSPIADVYIRKYSGNGDQQLKLFVPNGEVLEHGNLEGGIIGHPAVSGVLAVGAISASDPGHDDAQSYSDRGQTEIYFPSRQTRYKPDVMGIDGVLITGAGGFGSEVEGISFRRFSGTSAAAPHVAGIAALVMEAQRKADPSMGKKAVADAVTQKLRDTAVDIGDQDPNGYSKELGYGRADALAAIASLAGSSTSLDLYSKTSFTDTHTVNSIGDGADSDTSDGVCDDGTVDGSTNCTLRAAIQQTNAGTGAIIKFNVSGGGVQTISPASALPTITKPVFFDGYSQSGASATTLLIELDGASAGTGANGLTISGGDSVVRGLAVNSFGSNGIVLQGSGGGQVIAGNHIGTDDTGATGEGNGAAGVYVNGSPNVVLRDNVISGNSTHGVHITGSAAKKTVIFGNTIGLNAAGTDDLGNTMAGVYVDGAEEAILRENVISGNDTHGISLSGSGAGNADIQYNRIGTDDAGTAALGNTGSGIRISGARNSGIYENIIGDNDSHGISLTGSGTMDTFIGENYIGTNSSGIDLGNGGSGIHIANGSNNNFVEVNTIANNAGDGVTVTATTAGDSPGNTIWENSIHDNTGHGIDLGDDGATANDTRDVDSGPNHLQNYPYDITFANRSDDASVRYTLALTPNRRYAIDFYSCDSTTDGEGAIWLGYNILSVANPGSLDAMGEATFTASTILDNYLEFTAPDSAATHITATATDSLTNSTSEFAPCIERAALPELVISESSIGVTEGDTTDYTIALSAPPSADVTVTLSSGDTEVATVSDATLTFTPTNGTTEQTVTVTGVADDDAGYEATEIRHLVTIGGKGYVTAVIPVDVADDDVPGLTLTSTTTDVIFPTTTEAAVGHFFDGHFGTGDHTFNEGTTVTYTVALSGEPDGDTTIDLSSSDTTALTVSPSSITFTKTNEDSDPDKYQWDDPQTVTLTAVSDTGSVDEIESVYHRTTVDSSSYTLARVRAIIRDFNLPALTYQKNGDVIDEITIANEGATATYTIVPATEPSADLVVRISSSDLDSVTVSPSQHTFTVGTGGNWATPLTVTVTGVADGDTLDDIAFIQHRTTFEGEVVSWASVRVTVTDSNRAPYFEDGLETTREIPETATQNDDVGGPITATDLDSGDTLTYTLDDPSGLFAINGATGQITVAITDPPVAQPFDYETGTRDYSMDVSVSDTGGLEDKIDVKVVVTDVNEAPTVAGEATLSFPEDTATTRVLDRYTATDPEQGTITWSVEGTDAGVFTIDGSGNLRFNGQQDYETRVSLDITIAATDDGDPALKGELPVTVTLTNVDEPPAITGGETLTFDENTETTTILQTYSASDPEGVTSISSWSLGGTDAGDFEISSTGGLTFRNVPDFERAADSGANNEYNVQVRATDDATPAKTGRFEVTVTVNDVNEAPTISGDDTLSYPENTASTRALDRYTATDPERSSLTWTVGGTDAGDFDIDSSGNLTFAEIPDYEAPADSGGDNGYNIQVVATDDGNLGDGTTSQQGAQSASFDVTINVTPVNEPPTVTGQVSHSVNENVEDFSHTYTASDPEGDSTTFTWSLAGSDGSDFAIDRNKGILTFRSTPDYESPADSNRNNEYLVQVGASDGQFTGTLAVTVTVNDVNEPPTITGDDTPPDFPENSTRSVATYRATDPERATIIWTLGGDDSGDFNISDSGVLTFVNIPDFENPADADTDNEYLVTVRAGDGTHTAELDITVNVINSTGTEEPTITTTSRPNLTYPENRTSTVYTYSASDPQRGPITWSVTGLDADDFTIPRDSSGRGVLTFSSQPDYENPSDSDRDRVYEITVVATDEQGLSDELDVRVTVTEVNEGPEISRAGSAPGSVPENQAQDTVLARYTATDPEGGVISRWRTSGTDGGDFVINEQGELRFRNIPDYERPADSNRDNAYVFTVQVSDGSIYGSFEETVTVTPVNEPPAITTTSSSATTLRQAENRTSRLYTYRATDPEGASTVTWSVRGTDARFFAIDQRGQFSFSETSPPDFELPGDSGGNNVYDVTVQATDDDNNTAPLDVTVTVTDVNEGPEVTGGGNTFTVQENRDWPGASFTAADPEQGTVTRWALGGRDGGDFTITGTGVMTFRSVPDHERPADSDRDNVYEVEVRPYDGRYYGSHHVTVTVEDVSEISGPTTLTRAENFDGSLGTYTAGGRGDLTVDPSWSLTGTDRGDFTIDESGLLAFRNIPDYERPADSNRDNAYIFTVQVSDDRYYDTFDVQVTVTPVNEPPAITTTSSSATTLRQAENRTSRLYTYRATDPEGASTVTWSVRGTDARFFAIDQRGQFSFSETSPPDFELPGDSGGNNVYDVTVQATDDDNNTAPLDVTVTVTDVNEGPEVTGGGNTFTVQENRDWPGASFTAADPEQGTVTRWALGGRDGGDFTITGTGVMTFRSVPDHERPADSDRDNVYEVEVRPYDGRYYGSHHVTVTVEDVSEISGPTTLTRAENFDGSLGTYTAGGRGDLTVDPSWSLTGTDRGDFTIDESGLLAFRNIPDYERPADSNRDNAYIFTVQVSDDRYYDTFDVQVTVTPVNEPPAITTTSSSATTLRQAENRTSRLYTYRATDPEGASTVTWSVRGTDARFFAIDQRGQFSFSETSPPDFELPGDSGGNNVYDVTVQATDDDNNTAPLDVTVTVTDVNEGPEISRLGGAPGSVPENQDQAQVLARYTAADPEGGTVTRWRTAGTDGSDFVISEQGELRFRATPDFDRPADSNRDNVYGFTVQASDGRYYGSFDETVTVTNINEHDPVIRSGSRTSFTYREEGTSALYTYSATDGDKDDVITWTAGGTDGSLFEFTDRNALVFRNPPNYEAPGDSGQDQEYNLTVVATDSGGRSDSLAVTVTVTDVDEGPEVSGASSFTIDENRNLTNAVYTATDPEGANVARWRVGGRDGGDFFITQGGTLYFRTLPDYERPADSNRDNVYEVEVQPSDGRNTDSHPVTVTVGDVNEAPEIRSGSRQVFTQPENRVSRLYTYSAADPEGGDVAWSVGGPDAGFFAIDERGQFTFREDSPPDFDTPGDDDSNNIYNVTVQARDPESNAASLLVFVIVTEVNEGPVITRQGNLFGSPPGTVPENLAATQVLGTYTASDPERPDVRITRWSTSGRDGGDFVINALGQLMFRNPPDHERPADSNRDNVYEVEIRASDGRNTGTLEEVQTVMVTDVDEAPVITTTSRTAFSLEENRTSTLYTFRATDPEGGAVTWTAGGTDGNAFTMDERGTLSFSNPPDFESPSDADRDNVYNVTVQARDAAFNASTFDVVVTVTDHHEGQEPTITTRRPPATYRENDTRTIYTFRASDPQRETTIRWSLTGADAGDFTIAVDGSGRGVLTFNSPPDFESPVDFNRDNVYELAVVATDDDGNNDRVDFTITVTDHNEGVEPTISTRRPPSTYRENDTRTVYTFRASDPQRGTTIRWSLTGTDAGDFTITADSSGRGVLTFNAPPDFESPVDLNQDNVYELAVVAADDDGNNDRVDFAVTVTDINEGPQISLEGAATTSVPENTADTQVLADYAARDPENPHAGIYRWSTAGRDGGDFAISELGELRFRSSPDFERPADADRDNVYEVIIRAHDGRTYGTLEDTLSVTVTQVNEAPVITTKSRTAFSLRENSTSTIYTYRATDQDSEDVIRWSVEGTDGEDFAIYNGILTFRLLPDLEIPADENRDNVYEITVVAADLAGLRDTVDAVITITDQAEGPVIAGRTSYTVTENYDITQVLGPYTATDAKDNRPVFPRWSLSGRDGGDFVIDPVTGVLAFRNIPDYDRPADSDRDNVYEVTVRGHDSRAYGNLDVTVTVTPINEGAPVVTGRTTNTVRENTTSAIHTYRATDPDLGDTIAWSTGGADGHLFQVSEKGELSFREAPDFETPQDSGQDNVYDLDVVATDGGSLRGTLRVMVTVTALNEGPAVSGTPAFTINENQDLSSAVYTARDPEAVGGVTTTITWSVSGRDAGDFTIGRETGVLTFRTPPDYERPADSNQDNVYEVTIRAYDGRVYGNFDVTVMVEDVVEITGAAVLTRSENFNGVLATYSAGGQGVLDVTPAWRLTGTDSGDFIISEQGEVTFRSIPDHERPADSNRDNAYTFVVQVSDGSYYAILDVTVTVTPVNEPPAITGRDSLSFRENTPVTTRLHTYRAADPEGDSFTWGLGGLDANDFIITTDSSGRGVLTFAAPPNFDVPGGSGAGGNEYLVTIQARDDQGNTGELPVAVAVTDQNEGAVVTGQDTIAIQENRDAALILATYSAVDPEGQAITRWSLGGSDGGDFSIDENGALTFRNTPDFDRPADSNRDNEYRVTVRAYDGRTYGNLDVTVTVSNLNEHAPVIRSGSRTSFTYREESTSALYTYQATDGDRDDVIAWTTGGTDGRLFEFNDRNGLVFREPPDYENPRDSGGNNEYDLTAVATDSGSLTDMLDVTVTVTAVEEGPEVSGTAAYTVTENQDLAGATFTAQDPEDPAADVTGWRLAGSDAGDFTITDTGQNSSQLAFRNTPDYDRPADSNRDNEYLVTVRAYNGSTYGSLDVAVTVTDVNEFSPVVTGRETLSFRENTMSTLYTYRATDMDRGAEFAWSVRGTDGSDFTIGENGELSFSSNPNHEQPADADFNNVYVITVVASDGLNEGALDVTVTVTDVNEGPEISGRDTLTVNENHEAVLATYTGTDPEDTSAAITRWSVTGRDGGDFTINADGELTFRTPPDYERPADANRDNEYEVTVRASDGRVYGTYDVTVIVEAVDEAPEFQRGSRTSFIYRENGASALYTYRATDPEGADFTWSLGGDDAGDFEITRDGGVLTFREPPDYDAPADDNGDNGYEVTVVATDQTGHAANMTVTVTVTDVNEGPVISGAGEFTVRENHDSVLGTYTAQDPEIPDLEITRWSVAGRDGGDFTVNEAGELTFRNPPDSERPVDANRDSIYEVTVRASDGRYYGTLDVTVTVEAVDEAPEFQRNTQDAFVYPENGSSSIYTYRATDPEGSDVAWGLSGTDDSAFTMSEAGVLSFNSPPDYESPTDSGRDNIYLVTVEASDDRSNTRRLEVTVTVTNVTDSRVRISGTAQVGQTLKADTSNIAEKEGTTETGFSYQWLADDKDIEDATGSTYEVSDEDEGKTIKVKVTFTGDGDKQETLTSAATGPVAARTNSPATGGPAINGAPQAAEALTADTSGIADEDGLENVVFRYQWVRSDGASDADIPGATESTYTLGTDDEGKTLKVRVSFADDAGNNETLISAATAQIGAKPNSAATGAPAINGTARVGETLTVDTSGIADEDGLSNVSYAYQWSANDGVSDSDIPDATNGTYTPVAADVGRTIKVAVTFTDDTGNEETLTSATTAVAATVPGIPQGLVVSINDTGKLDLSWNAPDSDGGAAITGYRVQWKEATGSWDTPDDVSETAVSGTSHTVSGLTDGVEYTFRIVAVNSVGDSTPSVEARGIPRETTAPTVSSASVDGATLTITFSEELTESQVLAASAFTVMVAGSARDVDTVSVSGSAVTLTLVTAAVAGDAVTVGYTAPSNLPATGKPGITGKAQEGEILTAATTGIRDADGLLGTVFTYQWLADGVDIAGATGSSYTLASGDVGKTIQVRVAFTDDAGFAESLTSDGTEPVTEMGLALQSATVDGDKLVLNYSEELDSDATPQVNAFAVSVNGEYQPLSAVLVEGSAVTLTLSTPVEAGDAVTVDYTAPEDADFIQDTEGRKADSFTGRETTNNTVPEGSDDPVEPDSADEMSVEPVARLKDLAGNLAATFTAQQVTNSTQAADPLTASVSAAPDSHHGSATFTFELRFSETLDDNFSQDVLTDHVFTVTGGEVSKALQLDPPGNAGWEIHVTPQGDGTVAIVLPVTTGCTAEGAICTADRRPLSNRVEITVPGPGG